MNQQMLAADMDKSQYTYMCALEPSVIWSYLGLSGVIWGYLGLSGVIWGYLGFCAALLAAAVLLLPPTRPKDTLLNRNARQSASGKSKVLPQNMSTGTLSF